MAILIGIDEAGYGPNLGPLVIGYSAWSVPDLQGDLYQTLRQVVSRRAGPGKLPICDSKQAGGLAGLERSALVLASCLLGQSPAGASGFAKLCLPVPDSLPREQVAPSLFPEEGEGDREDDFELPTEPAGLDSSLPAVDRWITHGKVVWESEETGLPLCQETTGVEAASGRLLDELEANSVRLLGVGYLEVPPLQFNRLLETHGNKSRLLGAVTMKVAREALHRAIAASASGREECAVEQQAGREVCICCDRQGGRQRYLPLLRAGFPEIAWRIGTETPRQSTYLWRRCAEDSPHENAAAAGAGWPGVESLQVGFAVGGEEAFPVAAASMIAKYARELSMHRWNRFWQARIDGIHPTAGYPVDARRFREQLREHVGPAELPDRIFWRSR